MRKGVTEAENDRKDSNWKTEASMENRIIWDYWGTRASLMVAMVKRLPAMLETRVQFLGREDPLEKEMAIHSSTLAWKIPWTEEPDWLQSMGSQRVGHD